MLAVVGSQRRFSRFRLRGLALAAVLLVVASGCEAGNPTVASVGNATLQPGRPGRHPRRPGRSRLREATPTDSGVRRPIRRASGPPSTRPPPRRSSRAGRAELFFEELTAQGHPVRRSSSRRPGPIWS
ncbi:MAG: hypothetical protein R2695_11535 [Acidimicrobiales bacterium]